MGSSNRRWPTSPAPPASRPAPSTSTSAARTTCWCRSSSAPCARRSPKVVTALEGIGDPHERLMRIARLHLERLGRDRDLAVVFQVELRQSTKFMERFSATLPARLPRAHSRNAGGRTGRRAVPRRSQPDDRGEDLVRRARRDGDQLDAEPAAILARCRGRRHHRSVRQRRRHPDAFTHHWVARPREGVVMIKSVAVLGAGTMGAQIALHCANAGIPVLLLDVTARRRAGRPRARAGGSSPIRSSHPTRIALVTTGGFDDGHGRSSPTWTGSSKRWSSGSTSSSSCSRGSTRRGAPDAIVSSNTSGIPIAAIAEGRSADFRKHWLGTHFFNPPRYLRLLEVIPTADTDPAVIAAIARVRRSPPRQGRRHRQGHAELHRQSHRAVRRRAHARSGRAAAATPSRRSTRSPDRAIGRPGSATFRTMDIAGVDVLAHVMRNLEERLDDEGDRARIRAAGLAAAR